MSRLVVVVALVDGAREGARALLETWPRFDPGATGLERHHVFLTEQEAVFVFEADAVDAVELLAGDESLWAAAAGWSELVAGPPRLAEEVYAWIRAQEPADISFAPTPGPGDSEGGDLFAPTVG